MEQKTYKELADELKPKERRSAIHDAFKACLVPLVFIFIIEFFPLWGPDGLKHELNVSFDIARQVNVLESLLAPAFERGNFSTSDAVTLSTELLGIPDHYSVYTNRYTYRRSWDPHRRSYADCFPMHPSYGVSLSGGFVDFPRSVIYNSICYEPLMKGLTQVSTPEDIAALIPNGLIEDLDTHIIRVGYILRIVLSSFTALQTLLTVISWFIGAFYLQSWCIYVPIVLYLVHGVVAGFAVSVMSLFPSSTHLLIKSLSKENYNTWGIKIHIPYFPDQAFELAVTVTCLSIVFSLIGFMFSSFDEMDHAVSTGHLLMYKGLIRSTQAMIESEREHQQINKDIV